MRKINIEYDEVLKSNYELYSVKFSDLQKEVRLWYYGIDLKEFDNRTNYSTQRNELDYSVVKLGAIVSNHFYAYREQNGRMHLMDGYNRLLTTYGELPVDPIVYIKVLTDELTDNQLMGIMFKLNMWKLAKEGGINAQFNTNNFLDRGFRLFMYTKFGFTIYQYKACSSRTRYKNDMGMIDQYFSEESISVNFNYRLSELNKLFTNDRIVDDIKQIIRINDYLEIPFNNYDGFMEGFIRFLARRRMKGDMGDHNFNDYLVMLKSDKLGKKLPTMCGNDSTRKNIYSFFLKIEENLDKSN
jgi:hypothetical protein